VTQPQGSFRDFGDDPVPGDLAAEAYARRPSTRESRSTDRQGRPLAKKQLANVKPSKLRIIGGDLRGRGVLYLGDRDTRPMKESVREALFNIVGPAIIGRVAWDLFAGTGILAIESFSRGAVGAVAIEKSRLFARTIRDSAARLELEEQHVQVLTGDTFRIAPRRMAEILEDGEKSPWVVYFCPPYAMWVEEQDQLFELLTTTARLAPARSLLVTETDKFFDIQSLPLGPWDVRPKGNVTLAFFETTGDQPTEPAVMDASE
jgi:16S rRNA (guanine966-N2)-methyltransferase